MKKLLSFIASFVIILTSGILLTACDEGDGNVGIMKFPDANALQAAGIHSMYTSNDPNSKGEYYVKSGSNTIFFELEKGYEKGNLYFTALEKPEDHTNASDYDELVNSFQFERKNEEDRYVYRFTSKVKNLTWSIRNSAEKSDYEFSVDTTQFDNLSDDRKADLRFSLKSTTRNYENITYTQLKSYTSGGLYYHYGDEVELSVWSNSSLKAFVVGSQIGNNTDYDFSFGYAKEGNLFKTVAKTTVNYVPNAVNGSRYYKFSLKIAEYAYGGEMNSKYDSDETNYNNIVFGDFHYYPSEYTNYGCKTDFYNATDNEQIGSIADLLSADSLALVVTPSLYEKSHLYEYLLDKLDIFDFEVKGETREFVKDTALVDGVTVLKYVFDNNPFKATDFSFEKDAFSVNVVGFIDYIKGAGANDFTCIDDLIGVDHTALGIGGFGFSWGTSAYAFYSDDNEYSSSETIQDYDENFMGHRYALNTDGYAEFSFMENDLQSLEGKTLRIVYGNNKYFDIAFDLANFTATVPDRDYVRFTQTQTSTDGKFKLFAIAEGYSGDEFVPHTVKLIFEFNNFADLEYIKVTKA